MNFLSMPKQFSIFLIVSFGLLALPNRVHSQVWEEILKTYSDSRETSNANAGFGSSIARDGNYMVVGSPNAYNFEASRFGIVEIYELQNGSWENIAILSGSDIGYRQQFGRSVDISNETIVVGINEYNEAEVAIYVFEKPENGWKDTTETAKLTASDLQRHNSFGSQVRIKNDLIIASAPQSSSSDMPGVVYIFEKPEKGWASGTESAQLTASDGDSDFEFGISLALDDSTIVVGSTSRYKNNDSAAGAVYVFAKPQNGWIDTTETVKLTALIANSTFGSDVTIHDQTIAIGAPSSEAGTVHIFTKSDNGWKDSQEIAQLSPLVNDPKFGTRLTIDDDLIVASSTSYNEVGDLYIFEKPDNEWVNTSEDVVISTDMIDVNGLGLSLLINENTIIAGAPNSDLSGMSNSGVVLVFKKPDSGWGDKESINPIVIESKNPRITTREGNRYGHRIAIDDSHAVISAWGENDLGGAIYVYKKTNETWERIAKLTASKEAKYRYLGTSLDMDQGVIVAGSWISESVLVFERPEGGWVDMSETAILRASDNDGENGDRFGHNVAISGNTIVVGAIYDDENGINACGSIYIFERPEGVWVDDTETAKLLASDPSKLDQLSSSLSIENSLVVAGTYAKNEYRGAAYLFERPSTGWVDATETARLMPSEVQRYDYYGSALDISGETVVVTMPRNRNPAFLFEKPEGGWSDMTETAKLHASDESSLFYFGYSVSFKDNILAIGATGGDRRPGAVYVFEKPVEGWRDTTEAYKISDKTKDYDFGSQVAIDGESLVITNPYENFNGFFSGAAYFYNRKEAQYIHFNLTDKRYGDSPFTLDVNSNSPNPILLSTSDAKIIDIENNIATIKNSGNVFVRASQEGDDIYAGTVDSISMYIPKAPLIVKVESVEIMQGDEIPEISVDYSGFVYDDTLSDIDVMPEITINLSDPITSGKYDILLTGGQDNNYDFKLENGTLSIIAILKALPQYEIQVFPNPASQTFEIEGVKKGLWMIMINEQGQEVGRLKTSETSHDISGLSNGTYFLLLQELNGLKYLGRLIKN